jgi:two-component system, OmpR family, sensor kinase
VAQARITVQALIPGAITGGPDVEVQAAAYNTVQQQQMSNNLAVYAQNVSPPPRSLLRSNADINYLGQASLQLSSEIDTRIRVLDLSGTVVVDTAGADRGRSLADDPLVAEALAGGYARATSGAERLMYVAAPVLVDDAPVGVIYLSQSLRDVAAVLGDVRTRWLLATLIALLLSAAAGLMLSGAISRPLARLTAAAGAVAQGKLDQRVPVRSDDELGRLSRTFNEMTARLQAARQTQVDFVANVSHDLRTPLTAIKGTVETLRDGAVDDPEVRDRFLETIEGETDRLIRLVSDLLALSRADSEALNLRREPVDLVALAERTVSKLAPQAVSQGVALQVQAEQGLLPALVDADRVAQVLVNLLDNAIKYSRPGGTVWLRLGRDEAGMARVQVADQGIGIPAADLARIGERFYRADRARSRAEGGSGLGLAIARALVAAHGGRLWIESQEGRGTTVSFTLPV